MASSIDTIMAATLGHKVCYLQDFEVKIKGKKLKTETNVGLAISHYIALAFRCALTTCQLPCTDRQLQGSRSAQDHIFDM